MLGTAATNVLNDAGDASVYARDLGFDPIRIVKNGIGWIVWAIDKLPPRQDTLTKVSLLKDGTWDRIN